MCVDFFQQKIELLEEKKYILKGYPGTEVETLMTTKTLQTKQKEVYLINSFNDIIHLKKLRNLFPFHI